MSKTSPRPNSDLVYRFCLVVSMAFIATGLAFFLECVFGFISNSDAVSISRFDFFRVGIDLLGFGTIILLLLEIRRRNGA